MWLRTSALSISSQNYVPLLKYKKKKRLQEKKKKKKKKFHINYDQPNTEYT